MEAKEFAALVDQHAARLMLFARQWCHVPEDAVQEAFLKLARLAVPPDDPLAWLYRATRNAAIDAGKSQRRRERREQASARRDWFVQGEVDGLSAEEAVAALERLPAEQREVIVARLWGGLSFEQIGAVMGCSASSAHRRHEAGIEALRRLLGASCPRT
jgi:RNA polymerase sigma-70 factor (ECF subfamily)